MRGKANVLICWLCVLFLLLTVSAATEGKVIYVDDDAAGANDGSSWENAYNYLQDAMADANSKAKPVEIRVAEGIYTPDIGIGITPGDRDVSFQLINDVTIKGGYAGIGLSDPNARDIELYETIISGDLAGDDIDVTNSEELRDEPTRAENSYHVVTGDGTDSTSALDGFTIIAGNANGSGSNSRCGGMYNYAGSPTVTNCTFTRNEGSGIYNEYSNPNLTNCYFTGNTDYYGGGVDNDHNSHPILTNCSFVCNLASYGGGFYNRRESDPTITNCIFIENTARFEGGGISNENSSMDLTNCKFIGNYASDGGGIHNDRKSSSNLINCTFTGNKAYSGGAINNEYNSHLTLINCTFSSNTAVRGNALHCYTYSYGQPPPSIIKLTNCILWDGGNEIWNTDDSNIQISYSIVSRSQNAIYDPSQTIIWGEGNIHADPLFVDADGYDDIYGTEDDDIRLLDGSPCIDAGDISAVPQSVDTDVDGNPRIINSSVDMGAYEKQPTFFILSTRSLIVPEGGAAEFTVALAEPPSNTVDVAVAHYSGDPDITVESGGLLTFDASNYSVPQTVTLEAAEDSDNLNNKAQIRIITAGRHTEIVNAIEADNEPFGGVLLVDEDAAGNNNGSNWTNAYNNLQDALSAAKTSGGVDEIRVAQGTYRPDQGGGNTPGDKEATFQLINGTAIKGGFAGVTEANPDIRDIGVYHTVLSGDLAGNDFDVNDPIVLPYEPTRTDNSFHVVTASGTNNTALLDGFMIICGNAISSYPHSGGGIYNIAGSPTITDCTFSWNWAWDGGGMCNDNSSPTMINCTFSTNSGFYGGGMYNFNSNPTITNCTFTENITAIPPGVIIEFARDSGGGLYNSSSSPTITNCTFRENSSCQGGGIYGGSPILTNCIFSSNSAVYGGGITSNDLILTNCTLIGNQAEYRAGGISGGNHTLVNCIVWGNTSPQISGYPYTKISYSDIQGGWEGRGEGNIDTDPLFAEPGY